MSSDNSNNSNNGNRKYFDFVQREGGDIMIKQFCRNAVLYDVYEYPFKESQVGGIQNTVDFMISIDSAHFPKVYNFSQGVDFNINSMIIKQHLFIGIDLKNDTTHEKSILTLIFCPIAHAADKKVFEGFTEIQAHAEQGAKKRGPRGAMMFLISHKILNKCIFSSHSAQEMIMNVQRADAIGEMHAIPIDAKILKRLR